MLKESLQFKDAICGRFKDAYGKIRADEAKLVDQVFQLIEFVGDRIDLTSKNIWEKFLEDFKVDEVVSAQERILLAQEVYSIFSSLPSQSSGVCELANTSFDDVREVTRSQATQLCTTIMYDTTTLTNQQVQDIVTEIQRLAMLSGVLKFCDENTRALPEIDELLAILLKDSDISGDMSRVEELRQQISPFHVQIFTLPPRLSPHREAWRMCPNGHALLSTECENNICFMCEKQETLEQEVR